MSLADPADEPIRLFSEPAPAQASHALNANYALAAIAVVGCLLGAFIWIASPDGDERPVVAADPVVETTLPGPRTSIAPRPDLLSSRFITPGALPRFARIGTTPGDVCETLGARLDQVAHWAPSPVAGNGWECAIGPTVIGAVTDDQEPSSLFVLLRGLEAGRISQVQVKINLIDPALGQVAAANIGDLLATLATFPGLSWPREIQRRPLEARRDGLTVGGATFRVRREVDDPRRLNLTASYRMPVEAASRLD